MLDGKSQQSDAKPKRKRGANKAKPKIEPAIVVRTEASISQAEIIKLLSAHVGKMLDGDTAAGMELQILMPDAPGKPEGTWSWQSCTDHKSAKVRFATKGMR